MNTKTIQTYNQLAKEYDDETVDFWDKFPRTFVDEFAHRIKNSVLDVGSGPGRDGLILEEQGLNVTCLDASEAMIDLCKEKGLKAVLGDFVKLPFANASFEGVWAYTSLLHISKAEISLPLQEINRVLKINGIFGIGMIEGETEGYKTSSGVLLPRWFSLYTKPELENLLQKHGFEILYFEQFAPRSKNYLNFIAQKKPKYQ